MPIYEYQCNDCNHQFETLQKMSDAPLTDCPACEKPSLRKMVSAPGFRLSGSGWYETDFKSGKQKNLAKSDTGEKSSSSDKSGKDSSGKSASTGSGKEASA